MTASAWDVVGALVWTPFAIATVCMIVTDYPNKSWSGVLVCGIPFIGLSIYCIARLCGAHA